MVLAVWSFAYQQGGSSGSIDFRKFSEERIVIEDQINTQQENENLKKHDKYTSVLQISNHFSTNIESNR